jgi:hypothetical protein
MKKSIIATIILSFLMAASWSVQSQEVKEFNTLKTEVNIAVSNIFAKNNMWYPYYYTDANGYLYPGYNYSDYIARPELSLGVKFHSSSGAYRLSTNLRYNNITNKDISNPSDKTTYKSVGIKLNMGYEWHSSFNRINIYYGFDISTSYSSDRGEDIRNSQTSESKLTESTYGVSPLIGTNVFIFPRLSVGTEVKFIAEYVSGNFENKYDNATSDSGFKSTGFRTRFGPLGFISVNIHF